MTEYSTLVVHRGIITPRGKDIQLLPECVYNTYEVCGIKYDIGIQFNPTQDNQIFKADVNSWHTGPGSSPSMNKIGEVYFPDGLNSVRLGIILVKNIISSTQEKTFRENQDLITCLLEHHKNFLEKNQDLVNRLKEIDVNSVLIGKVL